MNEYRPAKKRITVSVGESVRIIRELQELSQNQLSALTGIPQATISAIENDRVRLGVERAKILARALKVHPGPDGHLKIPHLWPGQNPPPEVSTYPPATGQNEFTDVGLKDPYFFPFSSNLFPFAFNQRDRRLFEPVASYRP